MGNRSQVVDTTGTTSLTYDGLYRLTGVTYPNADMQSYTYDAQGNRLTKVHNGTPTSYSYDDADQMTLAAVWPTRTMPTATRPPRVPIHSAGMRRTA